MDGRIGLVWLGRVWLGASCMLLCVLFGLGLGWVVVLSSPSPNHHHCYHHWRVLFLLDVVLCVDNLCCLLICLLRTWLAIEVVKVGMESEIKGCFYVYPTWLVSLRFVLHNIKDLST